MAVMCVSRVWVTVTREKNPAGSPAAQMGDWGVRVPEKARPGQAMPRWRSVALSDSPTFNWPWPPTQARRILATTWFFINLCLKRPFLCCNQNPVRSISLKGSGSWWPICVAFVFRVRLPCGVLYVQLWFLSGDFCLLLS